MNYVIWLTGEHEFLDTGEGEPAVFTKEDAADVAYNLEEDGAPPTILVPVNAGVSDLSNW